MMPPNLFACVYMSAVFTMICFAAMPAANGTATWSQGPNTLLDGSSAAIGADAVRAVKRATGLSDISSDETASGRLPLPMAPYHKLAQSKTTVLGQNAASSAQHQVPEPIVETVRMTDMSYLTDLRVSQQGMSPASRPTMLNG